MSIKDYQFSNNTYISDLKTSNTDNIEVEVGDIKQLDFYPQLKLKRWNNEANLSVRFIHESLTDGNVTTKDDKIIWAKGDLEAHFYKKPKDQSNEDGAYEFEVLLNSKPESNVLEFSIQTKGLDFFYQPELTPEEIAEGHTRPENVVGSYAVYHTSRRGVGIGMDYKTGKAFHIYRPEIIDADGNKVWGELSIDTEAGRLSVTVPQDFLDQATYPVLVDPTFGNTAIGGSTATVGVNRYLMNKQTLASGAASVDSIAVYGNSAAGTIGMDALYYTDVAGTPTTRRNVKQANVTTSLGWFTHVFTTPVAESAANFWLGAIFSNTFNYYYDSSGGTSINTFVNASYSTQGSDPYNGSGGGGTQLISIYANYTAAATSKTNLGLLGVG